MNVDEHKSRILGNLQAIGLKITSDSIEGIPATVAQGIAQREHDLATKAVLVVAAYFARSKTWGSFVVYFYVSIVEMENLTAKTLEKYAESAYKQSQKAAKDAKKRDKNLKFKGITCVPVVLSRNIDEQTKQWVTTKGRPHNQAVDIPVVIDVDTGQILYNEVTPFRMRFFYIPGKELIEACIRESETP